MRRLIAEEIKKRKEQVGSPEDVWISYDKFKEFLQKYQVFYFSVRLSNQSL